MDSLREESKQGEAILVTQLKELRYEKEHIKSKYDFETLQRKRLHNQIEDMKGKIRVFCRVRPMNSSEIQMGALPVVTLID